MFSTDDAALFNIGDDIPLLCHMRAEKQPEEWKNGAGHNSSWRWRDHPEKKEMLQGKNWPTHKSDDNLLIIF